MLTLSKKSEFLPTLADDFFKPWNDWFDSRFHKKLSVPALNIAEKKDGYAIDVAAPGLKKADFSIKVDGPVLTISGESEKSKEEKDEDNYTRQEYNYSSFSRSLTLPDNVNENGITASYDGGVLKLFVPKKEGAAKLTAKTITVN
jgi:HSP20 family protein